MRKVFSELPNWEFDLDEVSAGVYEVIGRSKSGLSVKSKGIDVDTVTNECRIEASRLEPKSRPGDRDRNLRLNDRDRSM